MSKRTDLTGMTSGELTVLSYAYYKKGHAYWKCLCSCGRGTVQPKSALYPSPRVFTCGCKKKDYLPYDRWAKIRSNVYGLLKPFVYMTRNKRRPDMPPERPFWSCICRGCAVFVKATTQELKKGRKYSCDKPSCIAKANELFEAEIYDEVINHTKQRRLTYNTYRGMIDRVRNHPNYRHVHVHPAWLGDGGFEQFIKDIKLRPHGGMSLDRIDPNGDYEPANCRWADRHVQDRNRRNSVQFTIDGQTVNLCDIAELLGTTSQAVTRRIGKLIETGLSRDEAASKVLSDGRKDAQCAA